MTRSPERSSSRIFSRWELDYARSSKIPLVQDVLQIFSQFFLFIFQNFLVASLRVKKFRRRGRVVKPSTGREGGRGKGDTFA